MWSFVEQISRVADNVGKEIANISSDILRGEEDKEMDANSEAHAHQQVQSSSLRHQQAQAAYKHTRNAAAQLTRGGKDLFNRFVSTVQPHIQEIPSLISTLFAQNTHLIHIYGPFYVMSYPDPSIIDAISHILDKNYPNKYMILNMSEKKYEDDEYFTLGQINNITFKGMPAPPLILQHYLSIQSHNWLSSDTGNILLVHCYSGYGRSTVYLSCLMAWCGFFDHPLLALDLVCNKLGLSSSYLGHILPSQRRYIGYFDSLMNGYTFENKCLSLKKIKLNGIPRFDYEDELPSDKNNFQKFNENLNNKEVFRPYFEVWQNGSKVYTTEKSKFEDNKSYTLKDVCVEHDMELNIIGDTLIRIRNIAVDGKHTSALRITFHTAFINGKEIIYRKHELDGASVDNRFSDNFNLELHFEELAGMIPQNEQEEMINIVEKSRKMSEEAKAYYRELMKGMNEAQTQPLTTNQIIASPNDLTTSSFRPLNPKTIHTIMDFNDDEKEIGWDDENENATTSVCADSKSNSDKEIPTNKNTDINMMKTQSESEDEEVDEFDINWDDDQQNTHFPKEMCNKNELDLNDIEPKDI